MTSQLRIIVTGLIAQHPLLGGVTWDYLQYVLGLARLGHDVYYLEDFGEWPYDRRGGASGTDYMVNDCTNNVEYLEKVMLRITYVGAAFLAIVAIFPTVVQTSLTVDPNIANFFGGTGLLIVVSVALDLVQKIDSHLVMRNYAGLLEKG